MLRGDACCGGAASASRIYCSTCASIIARWTSSKPTCFSKKNSVSVDCLLLLGLGVAVGWFGVVGVTVVAVDSVSGETSARRGWRLGPIRALRVCAWLRMCHFRLRVLGMSCRNGYRDLIRPRYVPVGKHKQVLRRWLCLIHQQDDASCGISTVPRLVDRIRCAL